MNYSKDLNTIGGRLAVLFNAIDSYNLSTRGGLNKAISDMFKDGILEYRDLPKDDTKHDLESLHNDDETNAYNQITGHLSNKTIPATIWIIRYAKFFKCSADYLIGIIEKPTHETTDIYKASGLSAAAIQKLLDNPDVKIVADNLLKTNSIDYFIQALSASVQIKHMDNFIASQLEKKKIPGVTKSDLELFRSNLDSGNRSQIESFAIECFDNLLNKNLDDYFDDKATKRYLDNLDSDIKNKKR